MLVRIYSMKLLRKYLPLYRFVSGRRTDEIINQYTFNVNPDELIHEKRRPLKRTKIVCTIGYAHTHP